MDSVANVREDSRELVAEHWSAFEGAASQARSLVLAYAASLENEQLIASAWSDADPETLLRGVAVGMVERHAGDRLVLGVNLLGAASLSRCRAVWMRAGEPRRPLAERLLSSLGAACRARGIQRMVVSYCPTSDLELIEAATALGARRLNAPSDHVLRVAAGAGLDGYLEMLRSKRRNDFVRDLRRASEAGAVITRESPPSVATLDQLWPLQLDTYARKESKFVPRSSLFAAYRERAAGSLSTFTCRRDDALLGFLVAERLDPTTSRFAWVGHVAEPGLQVYVALVAEYIRHDILDGVTTFLLGFTGDDYKRRIGAEPLPCCNLYFSF